MSIGSRIKERRIQLGLKQEELANLISVSKGAVANYENGVSTPKIDIMYRLFDALHCDANYLHQDSMASTYSSSCTPEEFEKIIKKYRSLDDFGKGTVDLILDRETLRIRSGVDPEIKVDFPDKKIRMIRYYHSASAGSGVFILGNEVTDHITIPDKEEYACVDYAIRVSGHSMEPDYSDGDLVLVSQKAEMHYGDIGIFVVNGDCYIKEYRETELVSRNKSYENITISEYDNIVCMGKVIGKFN